MKQAIAYLRRLARRAFEAAAQEVINYGLERAPSMVIGGNQNPYLLRWWLIPRNPILNVYLHCFLRDDDDRALHDHPWAWASILIDGKYIEHTIAAGGIEGRQLREAPSIKLSRPGRAHRIELTRMHGYGGAPRPAWTIFITGPRVRNWGFHCPKAGWIPWQEFTNPDDGGATVGAGCGEQERANG